MTETTDRRARITDAALDIIATDGIRALTHRGIDRHLGLPAGSTSYYFRTKRDLLVATVGHLTERSRRAFTDSQPEPQEPNTDIAEIAHGIAVYVDGLLGDRARDIRARYALTLEMVHDKQIQAALAVSLFSRERAVGLTRLLDTGDPEQDAADLIALLEGLVFDRTVGARALEGPVPGTAESIAALTAPIAKALTRPCAVDES
ncbi:TetR/AcrR family transcriptional regulator [Rhodococcus sp. PvR099]|uniref:TetR/AcrR family transcriptional regulator n=1 Tax=Rhodococcus sp. PvR099 TaxID=2806602 RepID=UPI001AEB6AEC|nr:TetR family transcriptional regulator [Rhodococcus sp. PvR099]MBP1160814.1 DNA-binding transcriptional regulator YbjK [Rhodococcus sp. PvR099]